MLLVGQLNDTMTTIYTPDRNASLNDRSMMLWRRRLIFRQYIKNKKYKHGVKFFELCESNGIVINVKISSAEPIPDSRSLGQTRAIFINLTENFLGEGFQLYTNVFDRADVKKMKPSIIQDYNEGMSGIDRANQISYIS